MLLDQYLPKWDINKENQAPLNGQLLNISVLKKVDFSRSWLIRILFFLRGLPSRRIAIRDFLNVGFMLLEENQEEIVIGLVAQPWKLSGNLQRIAPQEFLQFDQPDFAKIGWNFRLMKADADRPGRISTITRIMATSSGARTKFGLYWSIIGLFSGLIRREMLRLIIKEARRMGSFS